MTENYIQSRIYQLRQLEQVKAEVDKGIKERETEIKQYMQKHDLQELHGLHGERCSYLEVVSKRFDTKGFRDQFGSLYDRYLRTTKSYRFKLTY